MKNTYHFLEKIVKDTPGTVIDHNWLDILTAEERTNRSKHILAELRDITHCPTNEDVFNLYEGTTIEELLEMDKNRNNKFECLNCGLKFEQNPTKDNLGYHCICPKCYCSFDADKYNELYML